VALQASKSFTIAASILRRSHSFDGLGLRFVARFKPRTLPPRSSPRSVCYASVDSRAKRCLAFSTAAFASAATTAAQTGANISCQPQSETRASAGVPVCYPRP
jgi:hypothetical protein